MPVIGVMRQAVMFAFINKNKINNNAEISMKRMFFAHYRGNRTGWFPGLFNRLTRWGLNSVYSHTELVVCDEFPVNKKGIGYSSDITGVRKKEIYFEAVKWDFIEVVYQEDAVMRFDAAIKQHVKYDYFGLLYHSFPVLARLLIGFRFLAKRTAKRKYCTEAVYDYYFDSNEGWRFDPANFREMSIHIEKEHGHC
jgi:hypothetical protein